MKLGTSAASIRPETSPCQSRSTHLLKSTASLQVKLGIKPIILDYSQSRRRLNVVDRSFLIWLGHQDKAELLAAGGLPGESTQ